MRNLVLVFFILCANLVEAYDFEKEGIYYNKTYKGLEQYLVNYTSNRLKINELH